MLKFFLVFAALFFACTLYSAQALSRHSVGLGLRIFQSQQKEVAYRTQDNSVVGSVGGTLSGLEATTSRCRNTVQGRYLMADDLGFVCPHSRVDPATGCCFPQRLEQLSRNPDSAGATGKPIYTNELSDNGQSTSNDQARKFLEKSDILEKGNAPSRFSCRSCNATSGCCGIYEFCVSCCLNPQTTSLSLATSIRVAEQASSPKFGSVFEYCRGRCRHNSRSVVHENEYRSPQHHCYRPLAPKPDSSNPDTVHRNPVLPGGVGLVVGGQGESCEAVCGKMQKKCQVDMLQDINTCSFLFSSFSCPGGCQGGAGPYQPAEVSIDVPENKLPGTCVYSLVPEVLSCQGSLEQTRRLCPCVS